MLRIILTPLCLSQLGCLGLTGQLAASFSFPALTRPPPGSLVTHFQGKGLGFLSEPEDEGQQTIFHTGIICHFMVVVLI